MSIKFLLALSTAFLIASGTSPLLPVANPNLPLPFPITTRAENFILLPPLTTLVTLLIATTLSSYSLTTSLRGALLNLLFLLNFLFSGAFACVFSGEVVLFSSFLTSSTVGFSTTLFSSITYLLRILSRFL